jgi:predicted phosphodiesterase
VEIKRKRRAHRSKVFFYSDTHFPHHDPAALGAAENLCRHIDPDVIVILGDLLDCYAVSRYDKDPLRVNSLQSELDMATAFLHRLRDHHPTAEIIYKEGNHEERLQKFLWSKAPALASLRCMELSEQLELDELGIRYVKANERYSLGSLTVTHGKAVRPESGNSGRSEMKRRGASGISGHTHRLGRVFHTDEAGTTEWVEAGCLCSFQADYIGDCAPNWQQGCVIGHQITAHDIDRIDLQIVPILNGVAHYQGDLITAEGVLTA